MKRFIQPVAPLCRLPKSLAYRMVAVGLTLMVIIIFLQISFAATPLLPKRTVPQRTPSQTFSTKSSLIQQVVFDEEEYERMVPPAPPLRKPWEVDSPFHGLSLEPESSDGNYDDFDEEKEVGEEHDELADFPPFDASQYKFLTIAESIADSVPQTFSLPQATQTTQSPSSTFVSNPSGLATNIPQTKPIPPFGSPLHATLGQVPNQTVNPYAYYPNYNYANATNSLPQAPYGYNPYVYPQAGTVYVNPYGHGVYGYPNTPGAYWGPTGFTPNPYAAYATYPYSNVSYPGYPPPYGYHPVSQTGGDEKSDSLSSTTWETLGYFNPFKSPKGPNRGVGGPLMMRSWRDRPFYLGAFGGLMSGGELVSGLVEQDNGGTGGIIFGWYADNYWGLESRLHFASLPGKNTTQGQKAYELWYQSQSKSTFTPASSRNNAISMFDVSVHYYPLGNAKWRPFLKLGLGTVNQQFRDIYGEKHNYNSFMVPWGVGLKYWWNERIALQMELTDNVLFAVEEAKTQNNVALTVGLNFPIGKIKRKDPVIYWPMVPSSGR